jgi:hypothetical protein
MAKIRWRLIAGLVSLLATVILTLPAMGAARESNRRDAVSQLNSVGAVADVIWPNGATFDGTIWPNPIVTGDTAGAAASP